MTEPPRPSSSDPSSPLGRILLIQELPHVRAFLSEVLSGAGHTVFQVAGGVQGLEFLESQPVDLVISDLHTSDLDGLRLTRILRSAIYADRLGPVPILLLSDTLGETLSAGILHEAGVNGFLTFPCRIEHLHDKVSALLRNHAALEHSLPKRPILLVDDEIPMLRILQEALTPLRYPLLSAETGKRALQLLLDEKPFFVILDHLLPDMTGTQVLRHIRAVSPDTNVVILTGYGTMERAVESLKEGALDFLTKPIDVVTFKTRIEDLIRRGQAVQIGESIKNRMARMEDRIEALEEKNSFNETVLSRMSDPLVVLDAARRVVFHNRAFRDSILGEGRKATRRPLEELLPKDAAAELTRSLDAGGGGQEAPSGSAPYQTLSIPDPEGNLRSFELEVLPVTPEKETMAGLMARALVVFHDVTARQHAEEESRKIRSQAVHTETLSSLSHMIYGAAHELNNPLAVILGFADLYRRETFDPDEAHEAFQNIYEHAVRCQGIVDSLTAFAQRRKGQREADDIRTPLGRALKLLGSTFEAEGVRLEVELDDDVPLASINQAELQETFTNILVNSLQAVSSGGEHRSPEVRVRAFGIAASGGRPRVMVEISNNGPPIPEEHLHKIFEPFFTTRKIGEGAGLGLSSSKGIVQAHGGRLEVRNLDEGGVAFTMEFPAVSSSDNALLH